MTEDAASTGPVRPQGTPNDPPPPPPPPAETVVAGAPPPPGGTTTVVADPPPPAPPVRAEKPDRPGMGLLPIALGVGLLAAAIAISTTRSRADGELDWSNYGVGLGATAVLLVVAAAALMIGSGRTREDLVAWPGAVGILGVGAMIGVGLEDLDGSEDWLAYLIGGVIFLLSVAGYAAVRRGAFVVTAILGLGVAYLQLSEDVISDIGDDDDGAIIAAITVAVFVLVVTAVGWLLRTRALSGVVAGVIGLVGLNAVLATLVFQQLFAGFLPTMMMSGVDDTAVIPFEEAPTPDFDNDVYVILAIAAVLTLVWALAASVNGNPGFAVLTIAMPATVVPMATFVLVVEHPTWWGVALGGVGAVLLALVALRQLLARRKP
ncbi:hypothetical protein [Nocardioides silvaticus]|uniref:hypothetical protein n=1 Tax=Nocardioides silvaticus TaxID=2201891 RepID=UPI0011B24498|nr:hypothetical protein [Nocardioides silvaticus]